jgi:hypothetical protein
MKFFLICFLICFSFCSKSNLFAQQKLRFGKTQYFKPQKNEKEIKIANQAVKVYDKIFPDTLEVPLNRYFYSDSSVVFVGVSFRYNLEKLYNILSEYQKPIRKLFDSKKKYFIIQGYINKAFVNRYAYYSKRDKLIYILNYTFLPNTELSITQFQSVINATIEK